MQSRAIVTSLVVCGCLFAYACDDESTDPATPTGAASPTGSAGSGGTGLAGGSGGTATGATGGSSQGGATSQGGSGGVGGGTTGGGGQGGCDAIWTTEVACSGGTSATTIDVQGGALELSALGVPPYCTGGPGQGSTNTYHILAYQSGITGDFTVTATFAAFSPSGASSAPATAGAYITAPGSDVIRAALVDDGTNRSVCVAASGQVCQPATQSDTSGTLTFTRSGATATVSATLGSTTVSDSFAASSGAIEFGLGVAASQNAAAAATATTIQFTDVTFSAGGQSDTFDCDSLVP